MKKWIIITFIAFFVGGVIGYMLYPKFSKKEIVKQDTSIKNGEIGIKDGSLKLLPDGSLDIRGSGITFDFDKFKSDYIKKKTIQKQSTLGILVNPFDLKEFGLLYTTPFIFGLNINVCGVQREFKEFKVLVGISLQI